MTGGRERDRLGGNVDDCERGGGEKQPGTLAQHTGHLAEDIGDGDAGVEQRGDHAPYQGHVRGGRNAVAGHVADDQRDPLAVEEKAFVPVASDRVGLTRWEIPSRYLDPGHRGRRAEQAAMHLDDELVLGVVALGALDGGGAQVRDGVERALQLCVERCRLGPGEADRADQRAVLAMQWQRCGGLDAGGDRVGEDLRKLARRRRQGRGAGQRWPERAAAAIGKGALSGTSVYRSASSGVRKVPWNSRNDCPAASKQGHVGVVGADARCGTKGNELRDLSGPWRAAGEIRVAERAPRRRRRGQFAERLWVIGRS